VLVGVALILRVMFLAFIAVVLMTYVVMPRLTRLLQRWLYPST
jgi:antibiotic biosynthesis monooxygenase (ABM) superfamily enzyme